MTAGVGRLSAENLKTKLKNRTELAILDAREEWTFGKRHILMASCVPLSRLELLVDQLVPRRSAEVVWCDDGEGLAERAAACMATLGYDNVAVLDGGIAAWENAGYRLYSGVHVPSKAFAEVVEHEAGTPYVTAEQLKKMMDSGERIKIYDSRSFEEYNNNSIPGATSVPGAELVYRFMDLTPSEDTTVIVNCGGRTRSIIGAQSLINAGFSNKIMSLKDGTMAWHLAGYGVVNGAMRRPPNVSDRGYNAAKRGADKVASFCNLQRIDLAELEKLQDETETHTLYIGDVRTPEEYQAGHLPGSRSMPGGQLIQETDNHLAVWGARVVLVDDNGIRATMTASWLKQMGWDPVYVLALNDQDEAELANFGGLEIGPFRPHVLGTKPRRMRTIRAPALKTRIDAGTVAVIDFDYSKQYKQGHIPGAYFATRARLPEALDRLVAIEGQEPKAVVFTSPDGVLARLAVADLADATSLSIMALEGGTSAWIDSEFPLETEFGALIDEMDDVWLSARELSENQEEAMREYLAWEINLVNQMADDDDQRFRVVTGG